MRDLPEPVLDRAGLNDLLGEKVGETGGISLYELSGSPANLKAGLRLAEPKKDHYENVVPFELEVEGFELGVPTDSEPGLVLASSPKGQHIHLVLNEEPYLARYEPRFEERLEPGRYRAVAFLSRSYHESVKAPAAVAVTSFVVGDPSGEAPDVGGPSLVYSRPKGTYRGKDARAVLLDFYLLNTKLSPEGNRVVVTVAGHDFTLTEWTSYVLRGLPDGEIDVRLRLVDETGRTIPGPYNDVTRTITVESEGVS